MAVCACGALQSLHAQPPQIGAQVWIEPGQRPSDVQGWFHTLAANHMPVARIFLMWSDIERSPGQWDFSTYDVAFRTAEREHVRIVATLTPSGMPQFRRGDGTQGVGVLGSAELRNDAAEYIRAVVMHYRDSPALDTWLLLNEPGQKPVLQPLAEAGFSEFLKGKYRNVEQLNASWGSSYRDFTQVRPPAAPNKWNPRPEMDWFDYWRPYQTSQLQWIAQQVRTSDSKHPLHLNPAGLVDNLATLNDDLPQWRGFLDSLGCSIHPGWHFTLLPRNRYAEGVSYVNDLVRGSVQPKPYWVTELQGGNNVSSASQPLDPTADETKQWLWTSVGAGAKRVIFWLLNARSAGAEAGEWSLLDFQQRPSERMRAASEVAQTIESYHSFFDHAEPVPGKVSVLLSLDTMTLEANTARQGDPARGASAQLLAALGYYHALSSLGVPPDVRHMDDYEWESTERGRVAIVPDARALSALQIERMTDFAKHGNALLLSGLSGFYDTNARAWGVPMAGSDAQPIEALTGARLKEVFLKPGAPELSLEGHATALPVRLWQSTVEIVPGSGAIARSTRAGEVYAVERALPGGGRVLWLPSLVETEAWLTNSGPLSTYLHEAKLDADGRPFHFASQSSCILRTLRSGADYVTVVANGTNEAAACEVTAPPGFTATRIDMGVTGGGTAAELKPSETRVTLWRASDSSAAPQRTAAQRPR